jgi:pimeloyl-ACP methyl ester carboxylesterase
VASDEETTGRGDLATRHSLLATVVLVHGLWMNGLEMSLLRHRLNKDGFATYRFSYPTVRCDIAANAARLQDFLRDIDADTVHLVGHSLGGLVILRLFEDFPEQRPGRIVLLGTPYRGSATARNLARFAWGRRLLGRSVEQALFGDGPRWQGGRELGVIAGTKSMGLGLLVGKLPPPNDGTVILAETQGIPGAVSFAHPSSHSSCRSISA